MYRFVTLVRLMYFCIAMTQPEYIRLDAVASTNTYLSTLPLTTPHGTVVTATAQLAGRGQRGNSWESAPGANITLSMLLKPTNIDAPAQFTISEIVSIAVVRTLEKFLPPTTSISIKWPNDIYAGGDRKICGILIEHTLSGRGILRTIAGIGLNVNQPNFLSDAPNPVSMLMIAGSPLPLPEIEHTLCTTILSLFDRYDSPDHFDELHSLYRSMLWRGKGYFPYRDTATGQSFMAQIETVAPTGHITLVDTTGLRRTYAFKEVAALID